MGVTQYIASADVGSNTRIIFHASIFGGKLAEFVGNDTSRIGTYRPGTFKHKWIAIHDFWVDFIVVVLRGHFEYIDGTRLSLFQIVKNSVNIRSVIVSIDILSL